MTWDVRVVWYSSEDTADSLIEELNVGTVPDYLVDEKIGTENSFATEKDDAETEGVEVLFYVVDVGEVHVWYRGSEWADDNYNVLMAWESAVNYFKVEHSTDIYS